MIAIVLLGLLACASAAPRYHHYHHGSSHYENDRSMDEYFDSYLDNQVFDTRRFWSDLSREMIRLDEMVADLSKRFPSNAPSEKIDKKEYKITLQLQGFNEKEVIVKTQKGLLVVQAVHEVIDEPEKNYLLIRPLPDNIGEKGSWTYENGLLTIVFPITQVENEIPTQTTALYHNSEVMVNSGDEEKNGNIGKIKGKLHNTNRTDLEANKIPFHEDTVEVTTYSVGLSDDIELRPMRRQY